MACKLTDKEFRSHIATRDLRALETYALAHTRIRFECCVDGHIWKAKPANIMGGGGCPVCANRELKGCNTVLETHGDWLLIDISTGKHPKARMAIDTDVFTAHVATESKGRIGATKQITSKYIAAIYREKGRTIRIHIDVLPLKNGLETDHIKHGTMSFVDNRRSNLRRVTGSQNGMNQGIRKNNVSGVTGVGWDNRRGKWVVQLMKDRKTVYFGRFDQITEAVKARKQAEREYFGEFAFKKGADYALV